MHASERLTDFAAALRPRLAGDLQLDRLHRALYATDASMYRVEPLGVLLPRHREDVLAAVEEAARFGLPVLPRGSGSSLAGSAVGAALVIDTTRHLDHVLALDVEARTVTVEPGVVLDGLSRQLAAHGLMVGPDPASSSRATLGGMVATNATGTHSLRHGSVVDHLHAAEAVLPDGTPVRFSTLDASGWAYRTRLAGAEGDLYRALDALIGDAAEAVRRDTPAHWRRAGGYRLERLLDPLARNAAHLLCGSEGTLGFITEATLGLVERPVRTALGVAHFESRAAALEAVAPILETDPAAVELFDRIALRRAYDVTEYRPRLGFVQGDPAALLIVEYYGASDAELTDRLDALGRVLGPKGVVTRCALGAEIADVWAVRKVGLGLAMSARLPVQALAFIEDAAVPVEHLPAYIARLEGVLAEHGTEAVVYAHASAGCLHVRPFLDTRQRGDLAAMEAIARASAELVKEYGGIVSSEHGDGLARSWLAPEFYGPELYEAYRGVKRAFDPEGRFNPGRVVEAPPMTEHLRHPPGQHTLPVLTDFDWGRDGGFAAAVERCNGNGACRKRDVGAMCPSFMVTRDEKDSTRGRANALREVLSGALPPEALTGPEIAEVMDLCVSCKACQAECPAQVDLAALKSEWQAMVWKTKKPSLRTRLIAHLPEVSRRAAGPLAPLLNAPGGTRPVRALLERVLGLAAARRLPPFARRPFSEAEVTPPPGRTFPFWRRANPSPRGGGRFAAGGGLATGGGRPPATAPPSPLARTAPRGGRLEESPLDRVALYADTFSRFHEPEVARAAVAVLRAAGFSVEVPPYRCCGRTLISKGFLPEARQRAEALVETLHPWAAAGVPIVGLEPSCILTLRDELRRLAPADPRTETVAQAALTFEEFVAAHRQRFEALAWRPGPRRALLHAHCHQKALSGTAPSVACLEAGGFAVEPLDAGCCGMAGAFGYEAEHIGVSRAMGERVLAPAVRGAAPGTAVAAAGTSCRAQVADLTGRAAHHPAVLLAEALSG